MNTARLPEFALQAIAVVYVVRQVWHLVERIIVFFDRRADRKAKKTAMPSSRGATRAATNLANSARHPETFSDSADKRRS